MHAIEVGANETKAKRITILIIFIRAIKVGLLKYKIIQLTIILVTLIKTGKLTIKVGLILNKVIIPEIKVTILTVSVYLLTVEFIDASFKLSIITIKVCMITISINRLASSIIIFNLLCEFKSFYILLLKIYQFYTFYVDEYSQISCEQLYATSFCCEIEYIKIPRITLILIK